jgi:hypothetical protein
VKECYQSNVGLGLVLKEHISLPYPFLFPWIENNNEHDDYSHKR